ncbi:hypothetical protein COOONC_07991 [Cooperia oncophora]
MNVALSMNTFTMSDERRGQTKIHQLLDKKSNNEAERFIALAFSQDAQQNRNVKLKMTAFFICLCPEFLGCLTRFFTVTASPEQHEYEQDALKAAKAKQVKQAASGAAAPKDDAPPPSMILDCDMQGVEVILVENSLEPDTSQALILSFNMKMVATPSPKEQIMRGGIEKLAIFSSYFAPWRRNEVTYEVLKPMNIGIDMNIDTPTKATNVVLKMSPMEIRMAPSIIRLLSNVNAEFAKSSAVVLKPMNIGIDMNIDTPTKATNVVLKMSPMEIRMAPSIIRLLSNVNAEFAKSSAVSQESTGSLEMRPPSFSNYWRARRIEQKKFWFYNVPTAEEACEAEWTMM